MNTQAFVDNVNAKVRECMHLLEHEYKTNPVSTHPLHFRDILGASDDEHWWRLYINPMDWEAALPLPNPRLKYNIDALETNQPKGFREGMVAAYQKYLINGDLEARFQTQGGLLTLADYVAIFESCKPHMLERQAENIEIPKLREFGADEIGFHGPARLAEDLKTEKLEIIDGNGAMKEWVLLKRGMGGALAVYLSDHTIAPFANGPLLKQAITAVFQKLSTEMAAAHLHFHQLRAIARAIRSLHIIHPFTNGCGRTNIFTLLPLLLLRYGFGLPLGGEHGGAVPKDALHMMFNGGYTVDEIAEFLYVTQDFGLLGLEHGNLATTGCLGAKGTRPATH